MIVLARGGGSILYFLRSVSSAFAGSGLSEGGSAHALRPHLPAPAPAHRPCGRALPMLGTTMSRFSCFAISSQSSDAR